MIERLRGRAGQRQRLRRLKRTNGLCEMCLRDGITRAADVVDHIQPLAKDGSDEDSNTRNLCDPHHDLVTAEQFGFDKAMGGRGTDAGGRPTGDGHAWSAPTRPASAAIARRPTPPGGSKV